VVAALAFVLFALLSSRNGVSSPGSDRTSPPQDVQARRSLTDDACADSAEVPLREVDLAGILALRADIRPVIERVPGHTYQYGIVTSQDMLSDGSPMPLSQTGLVHGMWPASYEIRRFASDGDDVVLDVLAFRTSAQADLFLAQVSSSGCHLDGRASTAENPPGTHNLIWLNPDSFIQEDAFLARGHVVYRVADVRAPRSGASPAAQEREALAVVDRLACLLGRAACSGGRGDLSLPGAPAAIDRSR
jgi:hypothetical protein